MNANNISSRGAAMTAQETPMKPKPTLPTSTQRLRQYAAVLFVGVALPFAAFAGTVHAGAAAPPAEEKKTQCNPQSEYCSPFRNSDDPSNSKARSSNKGNAVIDKYIQPAVAALSALAGIAVAGSIIFGGIQYATAGGDSGRVSAAKQRILKALFVLAAYIFFYAFMRWLLPGAGLV